ncbi:MAG: methyl-accepting chemotaxis protein [Planctomycetaceae bacterium]|nr:methyl-accepting chemotaxis protein [Planctomycetaceae bacterium]
MTLRSKFFYIVVFLMTIFVTQLFLTWLAYRFAETKARIADNRYQSYQVAEEFRYASASLTNFSRAYSTTRNPEFLNQYNAILDWQAGDIPRPDNFPLFPGVQKSQLDIMADLGFSEAELKIMDEALELSDELALYEIQVMESIDQGEIVAGPATPMPNEELETFVLRVLYDRSYREFENQIEQKVRQFFQQLDQRTSQAVRNAETALATVSAASFFLQLFNIVVMVLFFVYISRFVLGNMIATVSTLQYLAKNFRTIHSLIVQKLARGDWTARFDCVLDETIKKNAVEASRRSDEIGEQWKAIVTLEETYTEVGDALNQVISHVGTTLREINISSGLIVSKANESVGVSQSLSNGSQASAASLEQISASMGEINSQTKTNAESAANASDLAQKTSLAANDGQAAMGRLNRAMEQITKNSNEVQRVIRVIDDIAFQTNLLALNAAVEAARAGHHGKGFAVVAEEVRNLASRSAKAASETSDLITESGKEIEQGGEIATHTAEVLNTMVEQIKQTSDLVASIAVASNEQAQGVSQVTVGLQQIDTVTQQNTASAGESATAANEISVMASTLQRLVSQFTLQQNAK